MEITSGWSGHVSRETGDEATVHFRPPRRRYTPPSALMTLSRFAPMIDMSFLLLIFFMTTTRFAKPEGLLTSEMPKYAGGSGSGPAVPLPESPIIIRLTPMGPGPEDYAIRIDGFGQAPTRIDGLSEFLRGVQQRPGFDRKTPVIIMAHDEIRWDQVVKCWNAVLVAGCENVAFATP
jgi:biopolymer transport protein ExbD